MGNEIAVELINEIAVGLLQTIVLGVLLIVPAWKIHQKAGLTPALSLLLFVPFIGKMIVYLVLAFSKWPNTEGEG